MGNAAVARALVATGDTQGSDRFPAQNTGGVDRFTGGDARKPPGGSGAQISRTLRDDCQIGVQYVARRQEAAVERDGFVIAPECLADGDDVLQPSRLAQGTDGPGKPGG